MNTKPLIVEGTFLASADIVWKALTDKNEMKKWYFDLEEFKPVVGFEFRFWGGPENGTQYLHICEITDAIPNQLIAYNWRYDGYAGNSNVRFEITPVKNSPEKTSMKVVHSLLETFPEDVTDFAAKNFQEGWTYLIGTSLKNYVEK